MPGYDNDGSANFPAYDTRNAKPGDVATFNSGRWVPKAPVVQTFTDVIGNAQVILNGVATRKTSGLIVQAGQQAFTSAGTTRSDTINFATAFSSGNSYGLSVAIAQAGFSVVLLLQVSALNAGSFSVVAGTLQGGPTTYLPITNGQGYTITWTAIGQ